MRTNIDIDDDFIVEAMAATGLTAKKAAIEEAVRRLYGKPVPVGAALTALGGNMTRKHHRVVLG